MAKSSGGTRGKVGNSNGGGDRQAAQVNDVTNALKSYTVVDRWNKNTAYNMGWNDDAQSVIDDVAKGNYGFASDVAKTVASRNYRSISDKQAYVIAKAAVDNNVSALYKGKELKTIYQHYESKQEVKRVRKETNLPKKENIVAALKRRGMTGTQAWRAVNAKYKQIESQTTGKVKTSDIVSMFM